MAVLLRVQCHVENLILGKILLFLGKKNRFFYDFEKNGDQSFTRTG